MSRILITGPTGCIGAATVHYLKQRGFDDIVGFSRSADRQRLQEEIELVQGDIADADSVMQVVLDVNPSHIIHLAAFQTPDCQANPFRGMDINLGGTVNICRAAASLDNLQRLVNASSCAVYGGREMYDKAEVAVGDPVFPDSMYGFWKVAGEGIAEAFHLETGVPTVSLRLGTTYGPGRDAGMTSAPTTALKSAALGLDFDMPYFGREHYHFVDDVAAGFGEACIAPFEGLGVYNLLGQTVTVQTFVDLIDAQCDSKIGVAADAMPIPFVSDLDTSIAQTFPEMTLTALKEGVSTSLRRFREMVEAGTLKRP